MTDTITGFAALEWKCEHCGQSIADGKGSLFIRGRELETYREGWAAHERKKRAQAEAERARTSKDRVLIISCLSELQDLPSAVGWHARHSRCGLYSFGNTRYEIEVGSLRTHADVIRWTAHLLEKQWLTETDWQQVLYTALSQSKTSHEVAS